MHLTTCLLPTLHPDDETTAVDLCNYNTSKYKTLAELGMAVWHENAEQLIHGLTATMIVTCMTNVTSQCPLRARCGK